MPLIIATAFTPGHCEAGWRVLAKCGVSDPIRSGDSASDPHAFCDRLWTAHVKRRKNRFASVDPGKIGRAWEIHAADLIVQNADREHWGWASPKVLPLLAFWADFEPDCRFALFYASPRHALASALSKSDGEIDEATVEDTLVQWRTFHDQLLRFHNLHPDRSVLINLEAPAQNGALPVSPINRKLSLDVDGIGDPDMNMDMDAPAAIYDLAESVLFAHDSALATLFQELEATADQPALHGRNDLPDVVGALTSHITKEHHLQRSLDRIAELQTDMQSAKAAEERIAETKQVETENELLKLQLEQVQEELEHQFLQAREAKQELAAARGTDSTKNEVTQRSPKERGSADAPAFELDTRHFVDGSNWHDAEHDGRWTGPGAEATIRIPSMAPGRYEVTVDVVSGMTRAILDGTKLRFNGQSYADRRKLCVKPDSALAPLERMLAQISDKVWPFPARIVARVEVADENSAAINTLSIVTPQTMSPASRGEPDHRELGLRISRISLKPL